MAEEKEDTKGNEVAAEGFGVKVAAKGFKFPEIHFGNVLQGVLIALAVWYTFNQQRQEQALTLAATVVAAKVQTEHENIHKAITNQTIAVERATEVQAETSYILTLNQAQRERLNVQMPPSLRRKVVGRDQ